VGIVTGYQLAVQRFVQAVRNIFSQTSRPALRAQRAFYSVGAVQYFPGN